MALIDVTIIVGDPDSGQTAAGVVQGDQIIFAEAIQPRGSESRFRVELLSGRVIYCTGDPQSVLTP